MKKLSAFLLFLFCFTLSFAEPNYEMETLLCNTYAQALICIDKSDITCLEELLTSDFDADTISWYSSCEAVSKLIKGNTCPPSLLHYAAQKDNCF